ncbi:MAG: Gfo/Idh/MocA family oxidoreductase [Ignavibacteria bacterium]|nr:Gfo/Idh/MocA family oxidoreductase [Ignavibacteria bacterium]
MKNKHLNRREMLKRSSLLAAGAPLLASAFESISHARPITFLQDEQLKKPDRPITAVVLGAGSRGNVYAGYSQRFPDELKIVGVAEPIELRRKRFSEKYQIPEKYQWVTWEHALQIPKFADVLIITTPDHLHYGPAMDGLPLGYDLLLEKPIAQTWSQCKEIFQLADKNKRVVAICHVLRYSPYFRKMKEVASSGVLGDIVSIQHLEPVEHIHMSHSFVRGNWRNTKESNPMILAKSCHDLDVLRWVVGKPCVRVSSFGSLKHFRRENAPPGSTLRCTGGCAVESVCPFSALKIYYRNRTWLHHFDLPLEGDQGPAIMKHLQEGPYGRCVYHCDNDVVDHQVTLFEFENEVTAAFSMEALTSYAGRRTRIMGTAGDVVGDEKTLTVFEFKTREQTVWDASQARQELQSGHGGGDYGLVHDFVRAVGRKDYKLMATAIQESMESHLMAFKAEESRLSGKTVDMV